MTEEMIAAIAEAVRHEYQGRSPSRSVARVALTALEAAGFRVFRPDECEAFTVKDDEDPMLTLSRSATIDGDPSIPFCLTADWGSEVAWLDTYLSKGVYALVPVEETTVQ